MTVMMWYAQDDVNQEEIEQNVVDGMKKEADSTGEVMNMWKIGWCIYFSHDVLAWLQLYT